MEEQLTKKDQGFRTYDHLCRIGHEKVGGILEGEVFVFPKIDGTNASVWLKDGEVQCGSRNRILTVEDDNAGFCRYINSDEALEIRNFLALHPEIRLYGEWLVPHTLKTYREDAWRKFYVFDVHQKDVGYLHYNVYWNELLSDYSDINVIPPLAEISNPSSEQLEKLVEQNTYLIQENAGVGEGVVLKNYYWRNSRQEQPWGKMVRNEFKDQNKLLFGHAKIVGERIIEAEIAKEFVTASLVNKTRAKVVLDVANAEYGNSYPSAKLKGVEESYRHKIIPQLLGRVYHDLVEEEIWEILKKFKHPTIDFKKLQRYVTLSIKELAQDLF